MAVTLSYARKVNAVGLGANVKYISSKIKNSASAWAADAGAMYPLNAQMNLALAVQNIGTKMKFGSEEDALPLNVKAGVAYAVKPNWKVALDINAPVDNELWFGVGTEYGYRLSPLMSAAGRVGYTTRARDTDGLNGFTAGLGFSYRDYSIDYVFVPYGELGNTHRLSLGVKFN